MNKFKEILMKDFGWKLLSLGIAICLWFVVINIENPVETRNFTALLQIKNESAINDRGQVISNYDEIAGRKITIRVSGQRRALDSLYKNRNEIQAYIDLSNLDETAGYGESVPSTVRISGINESCQIESRSPSTVNLVVENLITAERIVQLDIAGGTDASYTMSEPEVTPSAVTVSGTQTAVDSVASVRASVNVESIKEDSVFTADLVPYNANGEVVNGVKLSMDSVQVYIPVRMSKRVELRAETYGTPPEGYSVDSIAVDPQFIYVLGDDTVLSSLEYIELPPSSVEGRQESFSMTYALRYLLPDGVKLRDNQQDLRATVTVDFKEELTREITLRSDNISFFVDLDEGLMAEVAPDDIVFTISGNEEAMTGLDEGLITGSVSVVGLEEGQHNLPIELTMPEGITARNSDEIYVSVTVTRAGDTAPPEMEEE